MSYILEALKKSEQERHLGQVPQLDSIQMRRRSRDGRPRWQWLVLAVLMLNAAFVLWLGLRSRQVDTPGSVTGTTVAQADNAAATAGKTATDTPALSPAPIANLQSPVPPADAITPPKPLIAGEASPAAAGVPHTATRVMPPAASAPVPEAPPAAQVSYAEVPLYAALAPDRRAGLVPPTLDVHVYSKTPSRRFVLINLQKYREGDRLAGGGRLLAITPTGVVVEQNGVRYQILSQ